MRLALNADLGESYGHYTLGDDAGLCPLIGAANVACGMHAGDPNTMAAAVELTRRHGVSLGAHPGFNDLWGFGRRPLAMSPAEIEYLVAYQIGALQAVAALKGVRVTHVKPHGALNGMAHDDAGIAMAIGRAIRAVDRDLIYVANLGSQMSRAGAELGLKVANECYADRVYDRSGKIMPRSAPDAVLDDPERVVAQVLAFLELGGIGRFGDWTIEGRIDTICIHGDGPNAVAIATRLVAELTHTGIELVPLARLDF